MNIKIKVKNGNCQNIQDYDSFVAMEPKCPEIKDKNENYYIYKMNKNFLYHLLIDKNELLSKELVYVYISNIISIDAKKQIKINKDCYTLEINDYYTKCSTIDVKCDKVSCKGFVDNFITIINHFSDMEKLGLDEVSRTVLQYYECKEVNNETQLHELALIVKQIEAYLIKNHILNCHPRDLKNEKIINKFSKEIVNFIKEKASIQIQEDDVKIKYSKNTRTKNKIRFVLKKVMCKQNEVISIFSNNDIHIEHLYPKKEDYTNHIGNLHLLEASINTSLLNNPYSCKLKVYKKYSKFDLFASFGENEKSIQVCNRTKEIISKLNAMYEKDKNIKWDSFGGNDCENKALKS